MNFANDSMHKILLHVITAYTLPPEVCTGLVRQIVITSSVYKFEASCLTLYLDGQTH